MAAVVHALEGLEVRSSRGMQWRIASTAVMAEALAALLWRML
jgi:hypothetical protein